MKTKKLEIYINSVFKLSEEMEISSMKDLKCYVDNTYGVGTKFDILILDEGPVTLKNSTMINVYVYTEEIAIICYQNTYGYMLPIELGAQTVQGRTFYLVGEDLQSGEYSTEIFECAEEAEDAFERRLQERR